MQPCICMRTYFNIFSIYWSYTSQNYDMYNDLTEDTTVIMFYHVV